MSNSSLKNKKQYAKHAKQSRARADTLVVLDFETSGLSPDYGDRPIEIGAVRIVEGEVTEHFQELMNPGFEVDAFIEDYTGITNDMLSDAESCESVMGQFADFIGDDNLLAHNASFDKRFLDAEFEILDQEYPGEFVCSLLVARRVFQDAPNHKLATLVEFTNIPSKGDFHRALYDSQMTAHLWVKILEDIGERYNVFDLGFEDMKHLCSIAKKDVHKLLSSW